MKRFFAFLEMELGKEPVASDVSAKWVKAFLNQENRSGFSASTLHRRKISLTQFTQFLSQQGEFSQAQMEDILSWKQDLWEQIYQREVLVLEDGDLARLMASLAKDGTVKTLRDLSIISLILETGLSVTEIISINLSDLDLRSQNLKVENERGTTQYTIQKSTQNLKNYLSQGRPELTQSINEEALFVSQVGGRISRQGIWQLVKEWGERAKLSASLSPRVLRNTAVMRMVVSGYSIPELQKRLGHSNRYSTRALVRKIKRNIEELEMEA